MNRATGYALAAVVVGLAVVTLVQRAPQAQAGSPPALVRWEYALLRFNLTEGGKWDWVTPGQSVTDDKTSIYRALGGQGRGSVPSGVSYIDIATQAGQHGWEVLAVREREARGTEVWFKRAVR